MDEKKYKEKTDSRMEMQEAQQNAQQMQQPAYMQQPMQMQQPVYNPAMNMNAYMQQPTYNPDMDMNMNPYMQQPVMMCCPYLMNMQCPMMGMGNQPSNTMGTVQYNR